MPIIRTPFGSIEVLPGVERHPNESVRYCIASASCPLETPCGILVPQFTANTLRKRQLPAISFHPNGMIRNLPLEEQILVCTPAGVLPAEQVTFYESGALKRIFPLNGTLSGYWTQEDEGGLAREVDVETPFGSIRSRLISAYFSPTGNLRSLTLWPGSILDIPSPLGAITARIGVSFHDSGAIHSLEPVEPVGIPTAVGEMLAFDPDAIGICGDRNSLRFRENGALLGLATVAHAFDVTFEHGQMRRLAPPLRRHPCDNGRWEAAPLFLEFGHGQVAFQSNSLSRLLAPTAGISISRYAPPLPALRAMCTMGAGAW